MVVYLIYLRVYFDVLFYKWLACKTHGTKLEFLGVFLHVLVCVRTILFPRSLEGSIITTVPLSDCDVTLQLDGQLEASSTEIC